MSTVSPSPAGQRVSVGMADFKVSKDPEVLLCSLPLGAGLAVILYEPNLKIGGLLHSLLPSAEMSPARAAKSPAMFIDSGLNALLETLKDMGAESRNLQAFVVGGAQVMDEAAIFNMGGRNHDFLKTLLDKAGISIRAEDVGGKVNRSVQFHMGSGEIYVKQTGQKGPQLLCKR